MPTSEVVIADSSPFVHLDRIGRIDLLPAVFGHVLVPEIVAAEVGKGGGRYRGIDLHALGWVMTVPDQCDPVIAAEPDLHAGEISALSLARVTPNHLLVIDDLAGRSAARRLGMRFIGTAGTVIRAKKAGIVPSASSVLDALAASGFRLASSVRNALLAAVGEA